MTDRRPNILLLTVDALRADRTSLYGYGRPTSPALEQLATDAVVCETAFSLGPFTQSACVQLFTSTPPLSHGGFDAGAVGRPATLFRHFNAAGYRTTALSTLHWVNRFFGYGEGLDDEHQLFIPNTLVGVAVATMRNSLIGYHQGNIRRDEMLSVVRPTIAKLFTDAETYCALRLEHASDHARDYPDSLLVNEGYDFVRVRRLIMRHRAEFEADPPAYVDRHLSTVPAPHEWLAAEWRLCRTPARLAQEFAFRIVNLLVAAVDPERASARAARFRQYVDAAALADKTIALLRGADRNRPFFIWCHFMDTHIPYVSGHGRRWYRNTPGYLARLGYSHRCDPALNFRENRPLDPEKQRAVSALYDAAVLWTDEQISRIVEAVDAEGLGENTIVAICGDHGEELGEHGDVGHYFLFYEHNVRIPMIFRRKGMTPARPRALVTTLDLAPTLAEMAGLAPAPGWIGAPVTSAAAAARETVVMETFYGGNCLFAHRPLYFGVRSHSHKLMWKEARDPQDRFSPEGPQLYDLAADPGETRNIYAPGHPALPPLEAAIARRMAQIPELPTARIVAAFGEAGRRAVAEIRTEVTR
jgi:arylsulfatase A-like enzyme